jgi:hypothetical protein
VPVKLSSNISEINKKSEISKPKTITFDFVIPLLNGDLISKTHKNRCIEKSVTYYTV